MDRDAEHLKLLSIFHYVVGGVTVFFGCFFIFHIVFGLLMLNAPESFWGHGQHSQPPPPFFGWIFVIMGTCAVGFSWTMGGLMAYAGHCLSRRKHHLFCMVVAGVSCLLVPLGTILGVFTLVVLQRPEARALFDQPSIGK